MRKSCKIILIVSIFSIGLLFVSNTLLTQNLYPLLPNENIHSASIYISDPDEADFPNEYYDLKSMKIQGQNVTFEFWRSITENGVYDDLNLNSSFIFSCRSVYNFPYLQFQAVTNDSKVCILPSKTNASGMYVWNKTLNDWEPGLIGSDYFSNHVIFGDNSFTFLIPSKVWEINTSDPMRVLSVFMLNPPDSYLVDEISYDPSSSDIFPLLFLAMDTPLENPLNVLTYSLIGGGIAGAIIVAGVIILIIKRRR